jgi:opacity protein-like surface antigen
MTRFVRSTMVFAVALTLCASAAHAQTAVPDPGEGARYSAQIDAAATLGHTSSSSFGGELDYRLARKWTLSFEFGHMRNITSSDLQARANVIAAGIQGTANPTQKATYYDFGVRYPLRPHRMWHPYLTAGIGAATVTTETAFQSGTNDVVVATGVDLQGTVTKALFVLGGGVTVPFASRYFLDGSYRYGRIFARTGVIENDNGINTQRLQIGVGIRF